MDKVAMGVEVPMPTEPLAFITIKVTLVDELMVNRFLVVAPVICKVVWVVVAVAPIKTESVEVAL